MVKQVTDFTTTIAKGGVYNMDDLFNTLTGGQASKDQDDPQEGRGSQSSGGDRDALNDLLGGMMGGCTANRWRCP